MKLYRNWLIIGILLISQPVFALSEIKGLRIWPSPGSTRVVFDITPDIKYKVYTMTAPERVVIDFVDTKLNTKLNSVVLKNSGINKIRSGVHAKNTLRIVLEIDKNLQPKHFKLAPNELYGHRLVLDLESDEKQKILALFNLDAVDKIPQAKDFIIAIDAGHGGEDPGAIGPRGTKEKHVAFEIAKHLKDLINQQPGMQAFLTRNGDYYLGFRERMRRARSKKADLFISIHADSYLNSKAEGASVFILSSDKNASVAARWLAKSENRADLVGGVSLHDKDDMLASVLFDLRQTSNAVASIEAAGHILKSLGKSTTLHKSKVESGGFLVLRSPDIPSLLVEAGFLSSHKTELKLRDKHYQRKIATAIMGGVREYFNHKTRRMVSNN